MSNSNSVYQVIGNYEVVDTGKNDYLVANKGDIIIDCERVDDNWFRGKNIRSGVYGLIPKANVTSLLQNEYSELEPELVEKLQEEGVDVTPFTSPQHSVATADLEDNKKTHLSRLGEGNYVDMSSEETLNCIDGEEGSLLAGEEKASIQQKKSQIPKPPRYPSVCGTTTNDEGYNSASHYSGDNPDANTNTPLLSNGPKVSFQDEDEAGYEVPNIAPLRSEDVTDTKKRQCKKKRSLMMLWKGKGHDTESKLLKETPADEARENYYDPPADVRDNYFLPYSSSPTVRVLLSFFMATFVSVAVFLLLLLLAKLHAVLCFSISAILFTILFVVPVTLYHRGILCVTLLLLPSMFGRLTKIGVVVLVVVFLILGPVIGIADKVHLARACSRNDDFFIANASKDSLQQNCEYRFGKVAEFCIRTFNYMNRTCDTWSIKKNAREEKLCNRSERHFCQSKAEIRAVCLADYTVSKAHIEKIEVTASFKDIVFHLLPLLVLFLLAEAYIYNRVYLTTKNTDNIYITQRLRELDTERRNRGLTDHILPLTRIELYTYLVRRNLSVTKVERESIFKWLTFLLVASLITVCLLLIENAVDGVLVATLSIPCLEHYHHHNAYRYRTIIYCLLGALLFMIVVQSHLLRLRSVVCDYIYPEMVETRSKHLYYKILHDRHAFARHVRRKIQLLSEEKRLRLRISLFSNIYNVLPARLQWMCDKFTIRTCMICDSMSYRKTVECTEKSCRAHYCFECHVDAGQNCLTCKSTSAAQNSAVPAPRSSFCV